MLQALLRLQIYDEQILTKTTELIALDKFNLSHVTNFLWVLGKYKYKATNNAYLERAIQLILATPDLDVKIACRNLWNLSALEYRSDEALKQLTAVVMSKQHLLNDLDVSNCIRAFAVFNHLDFDCLEFLLKQSIRTATEMKLFSLAVILHSFALMDIKNPMLINISKEIIKQQLQILNGEEPENLVTPFKLELQDAVMF